MNPPPPVNIPPLPLMAERPFIPPDLPREPLRFITYRESPPVVVPEPSTLVLLLSGLAALVLIVLLRK
jgi:hypothetical protein